MHSNGDSSVHYRNCNLSEAICGIEITRDGDRLIIRGDKDDPFSRGFICPKAVALQDIHFDKDRLQQPVRRTATGWQRIGWDEAFDEVANNLKRIQAQHVRNAVGTYLGNPTVHNYDVMLYVLGFMRCLHLVNRFSSMSV